jgi:hypothetical protein
MRFRRSSDSRAASRSVITRTVGDNSVADTGDAVVAGRHDPLGLLGKLTVRIVKDSHRITGSRSRYLPYLVVA